jgi:hypothetical protein
MVRFDPTLEPRLFKIAHFTPRPSPQNATSPALARQSLGGYAAGRVRGGNRLYGASWRAWRGFQGLDNSPEDRFLAAISGCASKIPPLPSGGY